MTTEPRTKAGQHLFDVLRPYVEPWWLGDMGPGLTLLVAKVETEATRLAMEDVAERVRGLQLYGPMIDGDELLALLSDERTKP